MAHIIVESQGPVRIIRIARPEKKNALTTAMYAALAEAVVDADRDEAVRVLLLTGAPGMFTAGNDLSDFLANPPTGLDSPVFAFLLAIARCEKPLVAAVDGVAVGIGTTLLLHCDIVIATPAARFALPFTKLGLSPEGGSSLLLPAAAGYQRASEWLLTGDAFGADAALAAGMINRVVAADALETTALELAATIAARPPESVRLTKRLLREATRGVVHDALVREGTVFLDRLTSPEAKAAFAAFLNR